MADSADESQTQPPAPGQAPRYPPPPSGQLYGYPPASGQASGYPPPPSGQPYGYPPASGQAPGYPPPPSGQPYGKPPASGQVPGYPPPPSGQPYGCPPASGQASGYPPPPSGQPYGYPPASGQASGYPPAPGPPKEVDSPPDQAYGYGSPPDIAPDKNFPIVMKMDLNAKGRGTIVPWPNFDEEEDANTLRKAMKGLGTDEDAIINLVASRSNEQRQIIKQRFKLKFGKDLIEELKAELSGNLEDIILALMTDAKDFDATNLRKAMKGSGKDTSAIIEIMCKQSNKEMNETKQSYLTLYGRNLEADLVAETDGHFKRLLVSLAQGAREENQVVDMARAQREAQELYQSGEKKWHADESIFNSIIAIRSRAQLMATFQEYTKISQRSIENSIDTNVTGEFKSGLLAVVKCMTAPAGFFAERLFHSMKGTGTDDLTLIRIVVSRSEIDLVDIKEAFLAKYHKTLYKMIEGEKVGDPNYKKILKAIVKKDM